jgi:peptidoglycan/LPS O-acetylase OafA/YrhL
MSVAGPALARETKKPQEAQDQSVGVAPSSAVGPESDRLRMGRLAAAPRSSPPHRADIQGLRAVAVLLVVLGHAGVWFLRGGFVGVDVFFVLSGFLITSLLLAEARARGSVSLLDFYLRRARRILPAAALTLVATDVAAYFLLNFIRAREAVHDSIAAAAFASNFRFAAREVDYFARADPPSPLLHYWSLAVEEQFYFVWPLLFSIALFGIAVKRRSGPAGGRHRRRLLGVVVVLTAASLAWSIHATAMLPAAAYFSPLTRAWELGIGATLAVSASALVRSPPVARLVMGWAGMAAIAYAAVVYSDSTPFPGSAALVPTIGTALAIVAGLGDRSPRLAVARLLAVRPMRIVGDRSYALYLWHWPVLILAAQYVGHELSVPVKLGLLVGAFLLSCASYALVENPIRRGMRSRTATGIVVAICAAAILSTSAVSLGAIDREQQRFEAPVAGAPIARGGLAGSESSARGSVLPAVVSAVAAARRGAPIPAGLVPPIGQLRNVPPQYAVPDGCIGQNLRTGTTSRICRIGDRSSRRLIVLLGDSHANMWLPAVLEMARRDHWAVIPLVRLGCTPGWWIRNDRSASCRRWYDWALRQIRQLRPRVTLLGGSIGDRPSTSVRAATAGVIAAARALEPLGPVVVIGDPEALDQDPIDCLLSRRASMARCTTTWPRASLAAYNQVDRTTRQLGVGFLRTRGFVCYQRQCPAVVGRMIAWRDANHLSAVYSAELADAFRAGFRRAVARTRRSPQGNPGRGSPADAR